MNRKAFASLLSGILLSTWPLYSAADCRFQNPQQQQDCLKREQQARQAAETQRRQQLQQQQALQRAQEQVRQQQLLQQQAIQRQQEQQRQQQEALRKQQLQQQAQQKAQAQQRPAVAPAPRVAPSRPAVTTAKPSASPTPAPSRTAGMIPVTLGNGQRVFVNAQGAYFDASGNPISNQSVATATKGTPAITLTPAPQVVPPKTAPTAAPAVSVGSTTSRVQVPSVTTAPALSRTAGMTPVTLGNGQQAFVNSQGAFVDASGNPISNQSVASATRGTPAITPPSALQSAPPKSAPAAPPTTSVGSASSRAQDPSATLTPIVSRTAGMTSITLGNGQQAFVNAQGAFFDASGNPISNRSVATATKGSPAIAPAPVSQVAPPKSPLTPAPAVPVGSATSRTQASNSGPNSDSQQTAAQTQVVKAPIASSPSTPQTIPQVAPGTPGTVGSVIGSAANRALSATNASATNTASTTPSKPTATPTPTVSRTAGMTPVTLGNGQRVFVNSQGAYFDASGNPISNQSVATATKGTPAITPTPASQALSPKAAATVTPTPLAPRTEGLPSTQELEKYGVEQLAAMPKKQLVNLSPDKRHHLDVYLSAKADAAKYQAEVARYEAEAAHLNRGLDTAQAGLAAAGVVPVVGAAADLVNTGVSIARGDPAGAALNAAAMVPGPSGAIAGAASIGRAASRVADLIPSANNYRAVFFRVFPTAPRTLHVHHSFPQQFEETMTQAGVNIHDAQHLRAISQSDHVKVTNAWAAWQNGLGHTPDAQEITSFARHVDVQFGNLFWKP